MTGPATNSAPTETEPPTVGDPDPVSGAIIGSVHVADRDGDPLSYGPGTLPGKGLLAVNPKTGYWTYVPSPGSRIAAAQPNATQADMEDTFTVVVGDGYANATVTVTVPISLPDNTVIATIPIPIFGNPICVAFNPDGEHAYVVSTAENTVSVIDTRSYAVIAGIEVGDDPYVVAPAPDGKVTYTTNWGEGTVSAIDTDPASPNYHQVIATISVGQKPLGLAVGLDGAAAYVANSADGTVSVIDTNPASPTYHLVTMTYPVGSMANGVAVTAHHAFAVSVDGSSLAAIDIASHAVNVFGYGGGGSDYVAVGYHGSDKYNRIYISAASSNRISVFDEVPMTASSSYIQYDETPNVGDTRIHVGAMPQMLAVTPDTRRVYVPNEQGDTVSVIDTDPLSASHDHVIATIPVGSAPYCAAVSPDGAFVYVANGGSNTVSVICVAPA